MFTIVNKSTLVTDDEVKVMTRACATQLRFHAAPLFRLSPAPVTFSSSESDAAPGSFVIAILDDSDQAGALGWHTEGQGDVIYGEVFARPVLDNGGNALIADLSVASVLSHEVLETFADPHANLWADDGNGTSYAYEVCDPVESDVYQTHVTGYGRVTVSNFVTPHWFDPQAAAGDRLDYLHKLNQPFQMTPGGYVITMADGQVNQSFGEQFPAWRKDGLKGRPNGSRRKAQL